MKNFVTDLKKLIDKKDWETCKEISEKALNKHTYGKEPSDTKIFLYCGQANFNLGYLLIAQNMLEKCLVCPDNQIEAKRHLAKTFKE